MNRNLFFLFFIFFISLFLSGCSLNKVSNQNNSMTIAVTFYPIYYITKTIVANTSNVVEIIPQNTPIESYRLTPKKLVEIQNAKIYFKEGLGFNQIEGNILNILNKNTIIQTVSKNIKILKLGNLKIGGNKITENFSNSKNSNFGNDPHIWISPKNLILMTRNIENTLITNFPKNKVLYQKNSNKLILKFENLNQQFKTNLSNCSKDIILVNHDAFSYLAKQYNFQTIYISKLNPQRAPTPRELINLEINAKKYSIKYIFYSQFANPGNSMKLANQIGAKILPLYLLLGEKNNFGLIEQLKENLNNLKLALNCK